MKTEPHTKTQSHEGNQVLPSIRDIVPPCEPATSSPLRDAVSRLAEAYRPQAIWLFGSQARGDASPDSDYDLMVIVPDNADRQHRKSELAYRVLRSLGRAFDVTVWRRTAFQEQSRSVTSLPATILREGVLVYAA
jgi:predicted nucleotidyltransferase